MYVCVCICVCVSVCILCDGFKCVGHSLVTSLVRTSNGRMTELVRFGDYGKCKN